MRTIKFRGKRIDDAEWIYGFLFIRQKETYYIQSDSFMLNVIPETVGQFSGLKDKNGKDIFEGDVLKVSLFKKTFQVVFAESEKWGASFQHKSHNSIFYLTKYFTDTSEVIGNIHDNPELL